MPSTSDDGAQLYMMADGGNGAPGQLFVCVDNLSASRQPSVRPSVFWRSQWSRQAQREAYGAAPTTTSGVGLSAGAPGEKDLPANGC